MKHGELDGFCLAEVYEQPAHAEGSISAEVTGYGGCQTHVCLLAKPKGMATNGRCRCLDALDSKTSLAVRRKLSALSFYQGRVEELERHKSKFPEPHYTMLCNILANGKIEP